MRQNDQDKLIIGVTGGTGSGKTAFADALKKHGAYVINADSIVSWLYENDQELLSELSEEFGDEAVKDGKPDRGYISGIVFDDPKKLKILNSIVHGRTAAKIKDEIRKNNDKKLIVLDVPIPVKEGFLDTCDIIVTIVSDDKERMKRISKRQGISLKEAEKRINAQLKDREYMALADVVIQNNGSLTELDLKAGSFIKGIKK